VLNLGWREREYGGIAWSAEVKAVPKPRAKFNQESIASKAIQG